jgi:hypothetical protein
MATSAGACKFNFFVRSLCLRVFVVNNADDALTTEIQSDTEVAQRQPGFGNPT